MEILSSYDLLKGKVTNKNKFGSSLQPFQMIPKSEKTEEWKQKNMDWFEQLGLIQIRLNAKRLIKNYNLAKGIIDKSDYIVSEENEYSDILSSSSSDIDNETALTSINFFPIIPNVIQVLTGEFSKRDTKLSIKAVDPFSDNEKLQNRYEVIKQYAQVKAKQKLLQNLMASGIEIESEEQFAELNEKLDQEVQNLPHIQNLNNKDYRSLVEQWAYYQNEANEEKYNMFELENEAFFDLLANDTEFWHIKLDKRDYNVELWSPLNTFYHKSPEIKYISEGNYVGRITLMSIPDIIDRYGYKMTEAQIRSLETLYHNSILPLPAGSQPSDYYDTSKLPNDQNPNSLYYQQLLASFNLEGIDENSGTSFLKYINSKDISIYDKGMCKISEIYWKSQKKVGFLTYINEKGESFREVVSEDYYVTEQPIYNTTFLKEKSAQTLMYGEHIDWFWVNEVYGGVKINTMLQPGFNNNTTPDCIYLDVAPIPFQFISESEVWNARLPVEGISKTSMRLSEAVSLVDLMKPYQIIYNLVNNQIKDLLIDELGTVIMLDHNYLPKNSMGEDWGKHNMAKAYMAMKDFSILPVDSSIDNLEKQSSFNHFQTLDMEQSKRFISRLKVGEWAKFEAFAAVGITPQRLGEIISSETATGTNAALQNSYAQTEQYFMQHINLLMPRVKEMMLHANQFYASKEENVEVQYTNSEDESIFFKIEGYKILSRTLKVFSSFKPNVRQMMLEMKQLLLNNNTTNATIYDLLKLYSAQTPTEILNSAKKAITDFYNQEVQKQQHEKEILERTIQSEQEKDMADKNFEATENQKDREVKLAEATIRAMGYSRDSDVNTNAVPDVLEIEKFNASLAQFQEKILNENRKQLADLKKHKDTMDFKEKELNTKLKIKEKELKIAKENKNKYDKK